MPSIPTNISSYGNYGAGTLAWPPPAGTTGSVITEQNYQYDNAGNIRYILEKTPAAGDATKALPERHILNTYDGIYRLLEESVTILTSPSTNETTGYTYDKAGNRLTMVCNYGGAALLGTTNYQNGDSASTSAIYGGPSNQVRAVLRPDGTSVQYRYDSYGCRSRRWVNTGAPVASIPGSGVDQLSYDRENRLISTTVAAPAPPSVTRTSGLHTFAYDARTRRVQRQAPGLTAQVSFSGGLSVQEYYTAAGSGSSSGSSSSSIVSTTPDVEYIRGNDYGGGMGGILYTLRNSGGGTSASVNHYNSRGDVICKTGADSTATVAWTASYQAFGTRPIEKGTNPAPHRANTKEEDATGLLNEGHRYRCLETGTFITRDPAGFVDGPNLYTYVHQNPWTHFDPHGLWSWGSFVKGLVTGAAVAIAVVAVAVATPVIVGAALGAAAATAASTAIAVAATACAVATAPAAVAEVASIATGRDIHGSWSGGYTDHGALSDEARSEKAGNFVGTLVGGYAAGRAATKAIGAARAASESAPSGNSAVVKTAQEATVQSQAAQHAADPATTPPSPPPARETGSLHYYSAESLGQDLPHFSVETSAMHTHQVMVGSRSSTTMVPAVGLPAPTATIELPLPLPAAAKALQAQRVGAKLGPYSPRNNSCLTNAADILRAGGADIPASNVKLRTWAEEKLKK